MWGWNQTSREDVLKWSGRNKPLQIKGIFPIIHYASIQLFLTTYPHQVCRSLLSLGKNVNRIVFISGHSQCAGLMMCRYFENWVEWTKSILPNLLFYPQQLSSLSCNIFLSIFSSGRRFAVSCLYNDSKDKDTWRQVRDLRYKRPKLGDKNPFSLQCVAHIDDVLSVSEQEVSEETGLRHVPEFDHVVDPLHRCRVHDLEGGFLLRWQPALLRKGENGNTLSDITQTVAVLGCLIFPLWECKNTVYLSLIVHQQPLTRRCYFDPCSDGHPYARVHPNPFPLKAKDRKISRCPSGTRD